MIKIICVGKLKEKYWIEAIIEYKKRIKKYMDIEIIEVIDEGITDYKVALKKESEKILKVINPKDYIITLEIEGNSMTSTAFSEKLEQVFLVNNNITFIIGGSYGLDESIKGLSKEKLSFSKMTFPHQMFRVMLIEQIYRAFKIMHNEVYHK
ncbi:MAG: 23S rRNA (pseudouridine(1915)-N(3))-methyltransferase RlmH [Bacilli bacterium]